MLTTEIDFDKTYTVEELMALPDIDGRYELIDGKLVEMKGPSVIHGQVILNLSGMLKNYLATNPAGTGFSGTAFELNPKNAPVPDVAFVTAERVTGDIFDAFPGQPDLAVEVLSRTDQVFAVEDKIQLYLNAGVRLIWVINPHSQTVWIYRPASGLVPQVISNEGELAGEDLLPGFKVKVSALFE